MSFFFLLKTYINKGLGKLKECYSLVFIVNEVKVSMMTTKIPLKDNKLIGYKSLFTDLPTPCLSLWGTGIVAGCECGLFIISLLTGTQSIPVACSLPWQQRVFRLSLLYRDAEEFKLCRQSDLGSEDLDSTLRI